MAIYSHTKKRQFGDVFLVVLCIYQIDLLTVSTQFFRKLPKLLCLAFLTGLSFLKIVPYPADPNEIFDPHQLGNKAAKEIIVGFLCP